MPEEGRTLEERAALFASRCIAVCERIPRGRVGGAHLRDQLLRSATGVAANYAEAEEAESRPDFIHKTKLAMKELAEARMWLRILAAGRYFDASHLAPLVDESLQLSRIMGKGVSTARRRLREEGEALE